MVAVASKLHTVTNPKNWDFMSPSQLGALAKLGKPSLGALAKLGPTQLSKLAPNQLAHLQALGDQVANMSPAELLRKLPTRPDQKLFFPGGKREAFTRDLAETFLYVGMEGFQSKAILNIGSSDPESCRRYIEHTLKNSKKTAPECTEICRAKPLKYLGFCIIKRKKGNPTIIFYGREALEDLQQDLAGKVHARLEKCPDCSTWLNSAALQERGLLEELTADGTKGAGWAGPSVRRMAGEDPWNSGEQEGDDEESRLQDLPFVTLFLVLFAMGTYVWFRMKDGTVVAGFDSFFSDGETRLAIHKDCDKDYRMEIWRWFLHQFSHNGWQHVISNSIGVLFFGIPLEGFHGHTRIFLLFQIGVLGGALGFFMSEVHWQMVGMSGGLFGLMGIQLGDVLVNLDSAKQRWEKASEFNAEAGGFGMSQSQRFEIGKCVLILVYIATEWQRAMYAQVQAGETVVSDGAHAGGMLAGIIGGIVLGRNIDRNWYETGLALVMLVAGGVLTAWIMTYSVLTWPPKDFVDDYRWCYARQVVNPSILGTDDIRCVRCSNDDCISLWANSTMAAAVNPTFCKLFLGGWAWSD